MQTTPVVPGYDLGPVLGAGGIGRVWAATRSSDGSAVAIKVVPVGTGDQAEVAARELTVLARAQVEGLVGFHEAVGVGDDPPCVAMVLDRVGGGSLEAVVRARGHLSVGESVTVLASVARTLAGLHALGVAHGDVTPANVLVERTGRPLLADLGVASVAGEPPGGLYGTEGFVAPEVLDRGEVGDAADVYAVGALAWWCVAGAHPGPAALRPRLEEVVPGLPADWVELTERALGGNPRERPTAAQLALGYFDSAPCEPLRMTVGSDETSLLTQRIRGAAVEPPTPGSPDAAHRPRPGMRAVCALRAVRPRLIHRRSPVHPGQGRPVHPRPRWTGVVWLAAALAVAGGAAVVVEAGWPAFGRSPGGGGRVSAPVAPGPPGTRPDPLTDRRSPSRDLIGLMQALADARASAMSSGDVAQLERLDLRGSEARDRDEAALTSLRQRGERYADVHLTVASARLVTVSATAATVDAQVDTAAYRVVGAGTVEQRPAAPGHLLRFTLVWQGGRWLVQAVREPGTPS